MWISKQAKRRFLQRIIAKASNALSWPTLREKCLQRMSKASSVVAIVTQQSRQSSTVSDRVQRTPEGHMSSDGTTSWWPAVERRWHLCAISETGAQSAARYRGVVPMRQYKYRWGTNTSKQYDERLCQVYITLHENFLTWHQQSNSSVWKKWGWYGRNSALA